MIKTIKEIENKGKVNDAGMMEYNYLIITTENEWLYIRENLKPLPQVGDNISYDIASHKHSSKGNEYFNVRYQVKPFMIWIWISTLLLAIGGFLSLYNRLYEK